jgi:hypothetical protein
VIEHLDAALGYAARCFPVFPVRPDKRPLTGHGLLDASVDPTIIRAWWRRWPTAQPAIATGEPSGVVALDIDVRPDGSGLDTLDDIDVTFHPETPTAHTPSGGCHLLFVWPGYRVKTVAGKLGRYLDLRADGGSLILPPGPGRFWDPFLNLDTVQLAPMPGWMVIYEPPPQMETPRPVVKQPLSRYGEAALDAAVNGILSAPAGQQYTTLNRQVFTIAALVAGGLIPSPLALEALHWAARRMVSHDARRPWHVRDLDKIVNAAFLDGLRHPRQPESRRA